MEIFKLLKINTVILFFISFNALPSSAGCKADKNIITILDYSDFGPPSMSYELLGQSWWSWESSGSSNPNEKYSIRVVVYRKMTLQNIQIKYPIIPKLRIDYRYVHFHEARTYLDKNIADNVIPSVTLTLEQTRGLLESQ